MTRSEMIARLVFAMGGRAAEELVFREPTTGAVSDIEQATKIARAMVTEYGMSSKLGAVRYGTEHGDPFLGRTMGTQADYSHEVAQIIDDEVRKLIEAAHTEAWEILTEYRDVLDITGRRAAGKGDPAPRRTPGDLLRREEASPADHVRRLRRPRAVGQAADQDARRAGDRAGRGVAQARSRARVQGRHRPGQPGGRSRGGAPERLKRLRAPTEFRANGPTQPDYGAPAGWHAPGWPPQQQPPAQHPQGTLVSATSCPSMAAARIRRISPTRSPCNPHRREPRPHRGPNDEPGQDNSRPNPPAHG